MSSLDVDSLLTDIPLEETINIFTNLLDNNEDVIEDINKSELKNHLLLESYSYQESNFIFNSVIYKQKDNVAMESPLGQQMFSCHFMKSDGWNSVHMNLN